MGQSTLLSILSGTFKNRKIPLPKKIHGHNNVTPQKIKESIFQIIENRINNVENSIFLDLYSGSGQMGIEAISRGFNHTFFWDISRERVQQIKNWIRQFGGNDISKCHAEFKDGTREFYKFLTDKSNVNEYLKENQEIRQVVIFADPPYGANNKNQYIIDQLLNFYKLNPVLNKTYKILLIIQTNKDDLFHSFHKKLENNYKLSETLQVTGFYEYGRHRIIVI